MAGLASMAAPGSISLTRKSTGLRHSSSRNTMPRSESAPLLTPLWEPDQELEDTVQPAWTNTSLSLDHDRQTLTSQLSLDRSILGDDCDTIPDSWHSLLTTMTEEGFPVTHADLLAAAQDSLRDSPPLRLEYGLVDQHYLLKKELAASSDYKVLEGVEKRTHRNFCLKIVPRRRLRRLHAAKPLDTMQAMYLIISFVHEVFCHPNYVCVVMKWGMHEIDSSHQLSVWIMEALELLDELLRCQPAKRSVSQSYVRVTARELQQLLLRTTCLDMYLNSNLWLPA